MNVKLLAMVFAVGMSLFLYNRANATGQRKPGQSGAVTPSGAKDQAGGEGAAALLPDMMRPYSQSSQSAVTYHSDLGSGTAPDGSPTSFSSLPGPGTPNLTATQYNAWLVSQGQPTQSYPSTISAQSAPAPIATVQPPTSPAGSRGLFVS
jgi:hypothetical protein